MSLKPMTCLALLFAAAADSSAQDQIDQVRFRPDVSWGQEQVGFRSQIVPDYSRAYRTNLRFDDSQVETAKLPRPLLINVWYPAEANDDATFMTYQEYFELQSKNDLLQGWANALTKYARNVFSNQVFDKPEDELADQELSVWRAFMNSTTPCVRDANIQEGKFPLVVYHSGAASSFEDNSLFCEYLASFGYIVVGSSYPEATGDSLNVDAKDGSVRDMGMLVRFAIGEFNADWRRVTYIGHSAGAQAVLRAMTQPDCPAESFVMLDSTVDYYGVTIPTFADLANLAIENASFIDEPMLVAASPGAMFEMCDHLSFSNRAYLTIPDLNHDEFISQGLYRLRMQQQLPKQRVGEAHQLEIESLNAKEANYRLLLIETRLFLQSTLGESESSYWEVKAESSNASDYRDEVTRHVVKRGESTAVRYSLRMERPPFPREIKSAIDEFGVQQICQQLTTYAESHADNAVYDNQMLFGTLLYELGTSAKVAEARQLHQCAKQLEIDGLSTLRFLAFMSQLQRKSERARTYLDVALLIDPNDEITKQKLAELADDSHSK